MAGPIERFTPQARRVLALAQQEALRHRHPYLTTEHLLLSMVLDRDNLAGRALHDLGVEARTLSERTVWYSSLPGTLAEGAHPELAEETRQTLRLAVKVRHDLEQVTIGTEHLLLGMIQLEESGAIQLLRRLHISVQAVTDQVHRRLQGNIERPPYLPHLTDERRVRLPNIYLLAGTLLPEPYHRIIFTENVLKAIWAAHEVACGHQCEAVHPEHLLVGVVQDTQSIAAQVLAGLHLRVMDVERVLLELDQTTRTMPTEPLFLSLRTTAVFDRAIEEARPMPLGSVSTEHLLLGLLSDPTVVEMLRRLKTDPERVRGQVAVARLKLRWTTLHESPAPLPPLPRPAVPEARKAHMGKLPGRGIAIYVGETDEPLIIAVRERVTLGRLKDGPAPDLIDLAPYDAYRKGVSRSHAVLTYRDNRLYIQDLGSSNGTWLDGQRLKPYELYAVQPGSPVGLGQLTIYIYY